MLLSGSELEGAVLGTLQLQLLSRASERTCPQDLAGVTPGTIPGAPVPKPVALIRMEGLGLLVSREVALEGEGSASEEGQLSGGLGCHHALGRLPHLA